MDFILSIKISFLIYLILFNGTPGRFMEGILIVFVSLNWELTNTFPGAY